MTKKAIEKLPTHCKNTIETYSEIIKIDGRKGALQLLVEDRNKLRGYLQCLQDMNIISEVETRALFLYYGSRA